MARAFPTYDGGYTGVKICFLCVEIFAWGKFGGFGRSTRVIGRELVKRGVEVTAIVPQRAGQGRWRCSMASRVLGFPRTGLFAMTRLIREVDADIYHSQHPSFATWLAQRTMPDRRHVVTFRDPKELEDWWLELTQSLAQQGAGAAQLARMRTARPCGGQSAAPTGSTAPRLL